MAEPLRDERRRMIEAARERARELVAHMPEIDDGVVLDEEALDAVIDGALQSSLDQALAERDRLAEVAKELAEALRHVGEACERVIPQNVLRAMPRYELDALNRVGKEADDALAHYEALRDG